MMMMIDGKKGKKGEDDISIHKKGWELIPEVCIALY
jgi:hypothetical protein